MGVAEEWVEQRKESGNCGQDSVNDWNAVSVTCRIDLMQNS